MKKLEILIGVAGTGKSTYVKSHQNVKIFESDQYRLNLFGTLSLQEPEHHDEVFSAMHDDLYSYIRNNESYHIIYDATNLNNKSRHILYRHLKRLDKNIEIVDVIFFNDRQTLVDRNLNREKEKQVPIDVVKQMYQSLKIPYIGYDCDKIKCIGDQWFKKIDFNLINSIDDLIPHCVNDNIKSELMLNYTPHDNPYHLEPVNKHIDLAICNAHKLNNLDLIKIAAFHDLGKGITKKFNPDKGWCQYLNHENVSAYYMLNYFYSIDELTSDNLELAIRVLFHMLPNDKNITEKAYRRRNISNELKSKLYAFNKIDRLSSIKDKNAPC